MRNCRYLCEDSLYVNLTSVAMTADEAAVLSRFDFMPDSKEFPILLGRLVTEVLQCRHGCWAEAERLNTSSIDSMLTTTLNYLQFCNFKSEWRGGEGCGWEGRVGPGWGGRGWGGIGEVGVG